MDENKRIEIDRLVNSIIELKNKRNSIEDNLLLMKTSLLRKMEELNLDEYISNIGNAKIISFNREGLIKDKVINTFVEINDNHVDEVNLDDHIKISKVKFVLVKGRD